MGPLNGKLPDNPDYLTRIVRAKVLVPFFVKGQRVERDKIVELARYDALSLAAIGKCEILK